MRGVTAPLKAAARVFGRLTTQLSSEAARRHGRKKLVRTAWKERAAAVPVPVPSSLRRGMAHLRDMQNQVQDFSFQVLSPPQPHRPSGFPWINGWGSEADSAAKTENRMNFWRFLRCNRAYFQWNKTGSVFLSEILGFIKLCIIV